jgi:hypothetical protein
MSAMQARWYSVPGLTGYWKFSEDLKLAASLQPAMLKKLI